MATSERPAGGQEDRATTAEPRWPLTGRERELALLLQTVRRSSVVVSGPAGVGKTRLLAELHDRITTRGGHVHRLTATHSSSAMPLGALSPLFDSLAPGPPQAVAASRAIAERLGTAVVSVDDAHLLDPASATLVHHLAQLDVRVVLSLRSDAPAPDAVLAIGRDQLSPVIELAPLPVEEIRALLHARLGADVDDATLRRLHGVSSGNLLYLRELVTAALAAGILVRERDVCRLVAPISSTTGLQQLVAQQLADVSPTGRELLEMLAVAEPLSLRDGLEITGPEALAALENSGRIDVHREGRRHQIRLGHPLYGEVLRARLSNVRRVALHRRAAELAEDHALRRRDDPVRDAIFRLEGGGHIDEAVALDAARHAVLGGDPNLGERLARVAMVAGEIAAGGLLLAEALSARGRHDEAEDALARAWDAARDDEQVSRIAMSRALLAFWVRGDAAGADAHLDSAVSRVTSPGDRDELTAQRATFHLLRGDLRGALQEAEPLLPASGRASIVAAIACAPALALQGRCGDSLDVASRALETAAELGPGEVLSSPAIHVVGRVLAFQEMGRFGEALDEARAAYERAVEAEDAESQAWVALMLGRTELARGAMRAAGRWFDEGASIFKGVGFGAQERWCRAGRVLVDAACGDPSLPESLQRMDACDPGPTQMMEPAVARARGWATAVLHGPPAGVEALHDAVALARAQGAEALESTCLHDVLRLGGRPSVDRLRELADRIDGDLAGLRARHAEAVRHADHAGLLEVAEEFERSGARLLAAEGFAQAGALLTATSQRDRARQCWRRADALLDEGHLCTPLLGLRGEAADLTAREREVAQLAAGEWSSGAIAQTLSIAPRTVENHLQRVYQKLGVHSRQELAEVLRRPHAE